MQPRGYQSGYALSQQVAVGGHGDVQHPHVAQLAEKRFRTVANQRLAAGDAHLLNAKVNKNARQAFEFAPGKNLLVLAVVFRVSGTAIDTPEITAVGDRDSQIGNLAPELVMKSHWLAQKQKTRFAQGIGLQHGNPRISGGTRSFPSTGGTGVSTRTLGRPQPAASPRRHGMSLPQAGRVGVIHRCYRYLKMCAISAIF